MVACAVIQFSTSDGFDAPCAGGRARVLVARNAVELQCNQPGTGVRGRVLRPDHGSPNRWQPVQFDRLPVKPVRPGLDLGRYQTGPNSKFKFEFKKMKNSQKISKNTSRCDKSNGVKFSQNSFI